MRSTDERREIRGFWWIPEAPSARLFGVLTLLRGEKATLEVFSSEGFDEEIFTPQNQVVQGQDEHGKPITLLFVGPPDTTFSSGMRVRRFSPGYIVFGIGLTSSKEFSVNEIQLWTQQFYGWAGITGFIRDTEPTAERRIRFKHPDDTYYRVDSNLEVGIGLSVRANDTGDAQNINEDAWISFRSEQGLSLRQCLDLSRAVIELLHFAILDRVHLVDTLATKKDYKPSHKCLNRMTAAAK